PVEAERRCEEGLLGREHDGHAGADVVALDHGRMADANAGDVGDRVVRPGLQRPDHDSELARPQERMTSSTSSPFRPISSWESASRFSRSSGSVFDGLTFMCQSSASTDTPSRWDTRPSAPNRSFSSCSLRATSGTGVFSSPVMKYCSRYGFRISDS